MFIRFVYVLFLLAVTSLASAQILQPARLIAETPTKSLKVGDEVELVFKASVDKDWYIYSVGFDEDCGPIPMAVTLEKHPSYSLVGGLVAINDEAKHDKIFDCDVRIFINAGEFRQKIKVLSPDLTLVGSYEGQVCSEVEGKCVLFSGDLSYEKITVTGKASSNTPTLKEDKKDNPPAVVVQPPRIDTTTSKAVSATSLKSDFNGPILDRSILDDSDSRDQRWDRR